MSSIIRLPISSSEIADQIRSNIYNDIIEYDPDNVLAVPVAANDDNYEYDELSTGDEKPSFPIVSDDVMSEKVMQMRLLERKQSITDRMIYPNNNVTACRYKSSNNTIVKICEWETMRDFKDGSSLPETTTSACFHCVHTFDTQPIVIPVNYYESFCHNNIVLNNVWVVTGNFCSWACQKKYIMCGERELCNAAQLNIEKMLSLSNLFFQQCYENADISYYDIQPAPSRYALVMFGGFLGIDEFRGIRDKFELTMPPIICVTPKLKQRYEIICASSASNAISIQDDDETSDSSDISEQAMFPTKSGSYDKTFRLKRTTKPPNQKCRLSTFFKTS